MLRNLKVLGLAVVAVLAMTALAAASAQGADKLRANNGIAGTYTIEGTAGETQTALDAFGKEVICPGASFTSTLAAPSETLSIAPTFTQSLAKPCKIGTLPTTVTTNGCTFLFHVGETVEAHKAKIIADLNCPAGKDIELDAYASEAAHKENKAICHVTIQAANNQGLTGLFATVDTLPAPSDITISGTAGPIVATQVRTSAVSCPPGTEEKAGKFTIKSAVTIKATTAGGVTVPLDLTG